MKNNNRLIFILKYLFDNTDASNTVTVVEINQFLRDKDLDADRKTIYESLKQLINIGYDIRCIRKKQNHYYLNSRSFNSSETKLLIDAVQSSRFISEEDSIALVEKLSKLVGEHSGDTLKRHLYLDNRPKSQNGEITKMIQLISEAMDSNRKISFQYYEFNQLKEKVFKHNGKMYCISPYTMVWNTDQYYVVGYNEERKLECKYRLDRMCSLSIVEEKMVDKPDNFDISSLFNQEFSMMGGEKCVVHLLCENDLMDSIIDKFGINAETRVVDEKHFEVIALVELSGTFYGWVFASQGKMKIISPAEAIEGFNVIIEYYTKQ